MGVHGLLRWCGRWLSWLVGRMGVGVVLGHLWSLWVHGELGHVVLVVVVVLVGVGVGVRLLWQVGGPLGFHGAGVQPGGAGVAQVGLPQLPQGDLHVGAGVGVAVARGADLLEVICWGGAGRADRQRTMKHRTTIALFLFFFFAEACQSIITAQISAWCLKQSH